METDKIIITKNEDVVFQGVTTLRKDISYDLLLKVFMYSLKNSLSFECENNELPISKLFLKIEESTKKDSPFYQQYNEKKTEFKKNSSELEKIETDINEIVNKITELSSK